MTALLRVTLPPYVVQSFPRCSGPTARGLAVAVGVVVAEGVTDGLGLGELVVVGFPELQAASSTRASPAALREVATVPLCRVVMGGFDSPTRHEVNREAAAHRRARCR